MEVLCLEEGTDSDISGDVTLPSRGSTDYWLMKIDALGAPLWQQRYGGDDADELNEIIPTSDGGLLIAGSSLTMNISGEKTDPGYGSIDWWVLKTNGTGDIIEWQHTFGSVDLENIYTISENSIGKFILGGFSRSANGDDITDAPKGGFDYWMMYLEPDGTKIWDRRFGGNMDDSMENLFQTDDGGYLLAGHSQTDVDQDKSDPSNGQNDFWVIKTVCDLNVEFNDTIVCPNEPVMLNAYDPSCQLCRYDWADDVNNSDSIRIVQAGDNTAVYSVTLTDGVGCQKSDDIIIDVLVPATVELGNDAEICPTTPYTLNAGNPGLDFLWSTGETTQTIDVVYPETYLVTVTNDVGCETVDSLNITLPVFRAYVQTTNISCGEDNGTATVIAEGGSGNYTYSWSTGGNGATINGLAQGSYSVVVSDGNCSLEVNGIVSFSEDPVIRWERNYGGTQEEQFWDAKATPDGGLIAVGNSQSNNNDLNNSNGLIDIWVFKLDVNGNIEWQDNFGGSLLESSTAIDIVPSGGYIVSGFTSSFNGDVSNNNGNNDAWILRLADDGTLLWEATYGGLQFEEAQETIPTWDGGFLLAGKSSSSDGAFADNHGGRRWYPD